MIKAPLQLQVFVLISVCCVATINVNAHAEVGKKRLNELEVIFGNFSFARYGLEFPHDQATLNMCRKAKEKSCLKAYKLAMNAKKKIQTMISVAGLLETFEVINHACSPVTEPSNSFACSGAVMALYFYKKPSLDALLLEKIKNLSVEHRSYIFTHDHDWYSNRPNPKLWIDYIQSAPIEWTTSESKRVTLKYFSVPEEPPYWLAP